MQVSVSGARKKMKLRNTVISLGIDTATAVGLSCLKVNQNFIIGSTTVVVGAGLIIGLIIDLIIAVRDKNNENFHQLRFALSTECEVMLNVI